MTKKITLILFLIITTFISTNIVIASQTKNLVNIYFFHSNTCSHCKEETKFLDKLETRYNNIKIYKYEVHEEDTIEILKKIDELYNTKLTSVPITIIGSELYTGYSTDANLTFIKTIEYYSKYGYEDKIGSYLELELPTYNIDDNNINLDKFIEEYHNYDLLGLKTDKLDTSNISLLLGFLCSVSLINLVGLILAIVISKQFKSDRIKLLSLILYIGITTLLLLKTILNNTISSIIIYIITIIIFTIIISKTKNKQKNYNLFNSIIPISISINLIMTYISNKNILIFNNILNLHNLTGLNKIYYYGNFIIIYLIINILITYVGYIVIRKNAEN